jgi:class 3 adenylate cyclase
MSGVEPLLASLRHAADAQVVDAIGDVIARGADRDLNRVNVLAFAESRGLDENRTLAAFIHSARIGLFDLSWNVLCPGCGGVLESSTSLKAFRRDEYDCALCAAGYESTLDELIEVTFTVNPRVRRIAAHDPNALPSVEYCRQMFWSTSVVLPDNLDEALTNVLLDTVELDPGEKALVSLTLPAEVVIVFDPVTHSTQFLDVKGDPIRERQTLSMLIVRGSMAGQAIPMRPGPLRLTLENHTDVRVLPGMWVAGDHLQTLMGRRRPFLTAKRLLTHQTFRDIYRTDTLDIDQRLKITSLTFLFTDLKGSTGLYDRIGDLAAFDLVRAHFQVLHGIVADQGGAIVKTIGDAVMATFPTPDRALRAALLMRDAMRALNAERGREDLLLKIGIHEGPCLAVTFNDRQDYFGQTVNIAARVQELASDRAIFATGTALEAPLAREILAGFGVVPIPKAVTTLLRGLDRDVQVFELP